MWCTRGIEGLKSVWEAISTFLLFFETFGLSCRFSGFNSRWREEWEDGGESGISGAKVGGGVPGPELDDSESELSEDSGEVGGLELCKLGFFSP